MAKLNEVKRVAVIVGTRPEAVKLAPVIQALQKSKRLRPLTICTSQHQQMVQQVFRSFGIRADYDLRVMRPKQSLWELSSRLVARLGRVFDEQRAEAVLVQGDTSSAFFGALSAFYHQIPVGHVEAGLRTGNNYAPFPEEMNRRLIAPLTTWHFAPTREAMRRLRKEGVKSRSIYLTGNTVVDALRWMVSRIDGRLVAKVLGREPMKRRLLLVTCHRRENVGPPMESLAHGLGELAQKHPDVTILFPMHPNPSVRQAIVPALRPFSNVVLSPPLPYEQFLACLKESWLVLSDSGGVQEEATVLGKPVLVLREETERPEGIEAGALKLVGTSAGRIVNEVNKLLRDPLAYRRMSRPSKVFGDGRAAKRIVRVLEEALG